MAHLKYMFLCSWPLSDILWKINYSSNLGPLDVHTLCESKPTFEHYLQHLQHFICSDMDHMSWSKKPQEGMK